ncbi:TELO2-interacting protein 2-like [Dreissena polymorpha]|uniref:TELO2-interacting protein 2 n=1 Tax=Dreissena polymorpha TaxID=45954 RepID=A0A9D4KDH8_DREPO|nr:TELO2-interacting protein 2-like [Dreissena polymorpha]KAH3837636.1 hypothetical protein DPMN_111036 [Dreissena polymorpha]
MTVQLKTLVCQINVSNGQFCSDKDRDFADHLYQRHSLQSMLETVGELTRDKKWRDLCDKYISIITVLIDYAPHTWISNFIQGFNDSETFHFCVSSLKTASRFAESQSFAGRDYTVYDEADFAGLADKALVVFNLLDTLLLKQLKVGQENEKLDHWQAILQCCYFCILLLSQHVEKQLWTNSQTEKFANDMVKVLMQEFCCSTVCKLLCLDSQYVSAVETGDESKLTVKNSIFGKLLVQWKPMLQRNTWKQNPVISASFSWCLQQMSFPNLSNFIELVLPPTLLFMDGHELHHKIDGTKCLIHILNNTGGEELRWYGRAEVIYSALKLQILSTEEELLPLTHTALLLILKVLVKNPDNIGVTTKYDEVFEIILQAASHENKVALRRVHTAPLSTFIEALGINTVKFATNLLEVCEEYLEIPDGPSEMVRTQVLDALQSFIKVCYPRIPAHSMRIVKLLVKFIHSVYTKQDQIPALVLEQLTSKCGSCLSLLKTLDNKFISEAVQGLCKLPFNEGVINLLNKI